MGRKLTQAEFLARCHEVHGDRYDYSRAHYLTTNQHVTITCPVHGEFAQTPSKHMSGQGCMKCSYNVYDKLTFISRAITVHGDKYDYTDVRYVNASTHVEICCPTHGKFYQSPAMHINKRLGCVHCTHKVTDHSSFVRSANEVHKGKYSYELSKYVSAISPVTITCPEHGNFMQSPRAHVYNKSGCRKCARYGFNPGKPATLYIYRISDGRQQYIGFGITNRFRGRDVSHQSNAKKAGFKLDLVTCFSFNVGVDALQAENRIKTEVPIVDSGLVGFRTEAANEDSLDDILRIVMAA